MSRSLISRLLIVMAMFTTMPLIVHAADAPALKTIRIGVPAVVANPKSYWGTSGIARYKGWFEEEFAKEGIRVEYVGFKGGAPMVGQALANGQVDLAGQGDFLSIIGKSSGLKTKLVLPFGKLSNAYLAVSKKSGIRSVEDLRGKRVAYYKGNQIHLQALRILALHGMTEKDIKSIFLDPPTAASAIAAGEVDALFGSQETLTLRDRGVVDVVYSTNGRADLTAYNGLVATEKFIDHYPDILTRLVKVFVKAAKWADDPANRDEALKIWASGPTPSLNVKEDYADRPWSDRLSPLLDPLLVEHYKQTQEQIAGLGMLRGPKVNLDQWIDPTFVNAALKDLKLEGHWTPLPAEGRSAAPIPK
ncbi:MAG: ABC transporter substrate-binding protein [Oxalicibacterium faecigallinarum]|uniref:ABC transporter substrate-binding protein n=1 Tax=Oxalicibacterium faecigallinarum TaxID=573741 RepID=UPI002807B975|nr:ABC transporter substrate-binding protein [Oxalicibacterium faecigallinarum]MDQ7969514.1 ABC transporter substrate-binding protein [Oxalicibacterium faecigallinarum]